MKFPTFSMGVFPKSELKECNHQGWTQQEPTFGHPQINCENSSSENKNCRTFYAGSPFRFSQSVLSLLASETATVAVSKLAKLLSNSKSFLASQTTSCDGQTWKDKLQSCQDTAENLVLELLASAWNALHLQPKEREWEMRLPNFWFAL